MTQGAFRRLFDLAGRRALVTGAAGILGQCFARGLADCGAAVVCLDLDGKACATRADELRTAFAVQSLAVACDVRDGAGVEAAIAEAEQQLGPLDILINNAASKSASLDAFLAPLERYDAGTWREVMSVNLD